MWASGERSRRTSLIQAEVQKLKNEVQQLKDDMKDKDTQLLSTQVECKTKIENWEEQELERLAQERFKKMPEEDDLREREKALEDGQLKMKAFMGIESFAGGRSNSEVLQIARNKGRGANHLCAVTRGLDAWCTGWLEGRMEVTRVKSEVHDEI